MPNGRSSREDENMPEEGRESLLLLCRKTTGKKKKIGACSKMKSGVELRQS